MAALMTGLGLESDHTHLPETHLWKQCQNEETHLQIDFHLLLLLHHPLQGLKSIQKCITEVQQASSQRKKNCAF